MKQKTKRVGLPAVVSAIAALGFAGAAHAQFSAKVGDTTLSIGGYIKLDAIYNIDQDTGDTQDPPSLVVSSPDSKQGDKDFRLHARQSRIWFKTSRPSEWGNVNTHIEGDFFGAGGNEVFSNSRGFRLRHAYGSVGGLLFGQTWTNFMQFTAYPDTVDFNGPMGTSFIRQAQVRYTMPLQGVPGKGAFSVSVENPEITGVTGAGATNRDRSPDFTARVQWSDGPLALEASGVLRFLRARTATGSSSDAGYGGMVSAAYTIGSVKVFGNFIGGDGIGRYLYESFSSGGTGIGDVFVKANGDIEGVNAYGFQGGVSQQWTKELSSGISYGRTKGDRPGPLSTDRLETIHFSNFYSPVKDVIFGAELGWQHKRLENSQSATAKRVQLSGQINF